MPNVHPSRWSAEKNSSTLPIRARLLAVTTSYGVDSGKVAIRDGTNVLTLVDAARVRRAGRVGATKPSVDGRRSSMVAATSQHFERLAMLFDERSTHACVEVSPKTTTNNQRHRGMENSQH